MASKTPRQRIGDLVIAVVGALFVLRLGGVGTGILPGTSALLLLLCGMIAVAALVGDPRRRDLARTWIAGHRFDLALALFGLLFVALQLPGLASDLQRAPLDIDQRRLAETISAFFTAGVVPHETVEDYPGVFYWLMAGAYLFGYLGSLMGGTVERFGAVDRHELVYAGRVVCTLLYGIAIVVVGHAGRATAAARRDAVGLLAAGLLTAATLGAVISGQFRNEAGLFLLVALALLGALNALARSSARTLLLTGIAAGLAAGIKYTGVFVLLPAVFAVGVGDGSNGRRGRDLALVVGAFAAALAASNPFLWLDFPNFVDQLYTEVAMTGGAHWSATDNPSWFYTAALARSFGWPLTLLAGAAAVAAFVRRSPALALPLTFMLPYQLFMTGQPAQFERWVYPLLPGFVLLAAIGTLAVHERLLDALRARGLAQPTIRVAVGVLALLLLGPTVWAKAVSTARAWRPPTYAEAEAWIADSIAPDDWVLMEAGWFQRQGVPGVVDAVDDLGLVLEDPDFPRSVYDWILVPETRLRALSGDLARVATFEARVGIGGNIGFDQYVVRAPLPMSRRSVTVDLSDRRSSALLGSEWGRPRRLGGRVIPRFANVFLALRPGNDYDVELVLFPRAAPLPPVVVTWNRAAVSPDAIECASEVVPRRAAPTVRCRFRVPAERIRDRPDVLSLTPHGEDLVLLEVTAGVPGDAAPG